MIFSIEDCCNALRSNINQRIIKYLQDGEVPWQRPWEGRGKGVGFPKNAFKKKKFFGVNFILLQIAAKEHKFTNRWWSTADQFTSIGLKVKNRPDNVALGEWGTESIFYKMNDDKISTIPMIVYNAEQLEVCPDEFQADPGLMPSYKLAEQILHATDATIQYNEEGEAWYHYPPEDYIDIPQRDCFELGMGGLPGYYESLAHELIHWTEPRLGYDTKSNEAIRELRAELGSSMLMEELAIPHSIAITNIKKWRQQWISLMKQDFNLIFKASASACRAVDHILSFTINAENRFNELDENAA